MDTAKAALLADLIVTLRSHPADWVWGRKDTNAGYIVHKTGVKLWIWQGAARVWEPDIRFGFFGGRRLRAAFRYWRRVQGLRASATIDADNVAAVLARLHGGYLNGAVGLARRA